MIYKVGDKVRFIYAGLVSWAGLPQCMKHQIGIVVELNSPFIKVQWDNFPTVTIANWKPIHFELVASKREHCRTCGHTACKSVCRKLRYENALARAGS